MIDPAEIAELRELEAEATPRPWRAGSVDLDCIFVEATHADRMGPERVLLRMNQHFNGYDLDAQFIAAVRNALPALLDAAESELAATKAKLAEVERRCLEWEELHRTNSASIERLSGQLAEVERERDELNWEASRRHEEGVKLRSDLASARRHMGLLCDRLRFEVSDHKTPCPCSSCVFVESAEQALFAAGTDANSKRLVKRDPWAMLDQVGDALEPVVGEAQDPEHQIEYHAETLPESYRRLAKAIDEAHHVLCLTGEEIDALDLAGTDADRTEAPRPEAGESGPVCSACGDTHWVWISTEYNERKVMCTSCPVPCERCRSKPQGPYCAATPCPCECHKPTEEPKAEPQPSGELRRGPASGKVEP